MLSRSYASSTPEWYLRLSRTPTVRLLLVPVVVYVVWFVEMYLLAGQLMLFSHPGAVGLYLYTLLCCLAVGIIVPVFLIRKAFMQGEVTMFQLGFRSWYRAVTGIVFTFLVIGVAVTLYNPCGRDTMAFFSLFLFLLPTGIATIMVCWVLTGTHIQALVRNGGALITIPVGVAITALLFGLSSKAQFPVSATPDTLFWHIVAGMVTAVFFFLVRDIWSTIVLVTGELVYLVAGWVTPSAMITVAIPAIVSAAACIVSLLVIHGYLIRHFRTIAAPVT